MRSSGFAFAQIVTAGMERRGQRAGLLITSGSTSTTARPRGLYVILRRATRHGPAARLAKSPACTMERARITAAGALPLSASPR